MAGWGSDALVSESRQKMMIQCQKEFNLNLFATAACSHFQEKI